MAPIESAPRRGGWYYGWNIVAVCILSQVAANGLSYNALSLFLHDWSTELHAPISQLQLAVPAMVLVASLCSPMVGSLADKYPARRLFVCGLLGMALFYAAIGSVTAAWQILAAYAVLAPLSLCLCTAVTANALISRWFVRRLGLALGLSAFGIGMAGVLLPPLFAAILPTVGWRMIWRGGAIVLVLIVIPIVLVVMRDRPTALQGAHYLNADGNAPPVAHVSGSKGKGLGWRVILTSKSFWLLLAIYLPMMALYGGTAQNIIPLSVHRGLSQQSSSLVLAVLSFSHLVATPTFGLLSDRFGNRLPFAGLAFTMVVGAAVLIFGTGLPMLTLGSILIGLGGGMFTLLGAAIAVQFGPEGFGRAYGMSMLFIPVATLAPFGVAKIQESTGSYTPGLMGLAVLVIVAGFLSLLLREPNRGGPKSAGVPMTA